MWMWDGGGESAMKNSVSSGCKPPPPPPFIVPSARKKKTPNGTGRTFVASYRFRHRSHVERFRDAFLHEFVAHVADDEVLDQLGQH